MIVPGDLLRGGSCAMRAALLGGALLLSAAARADLQLARELSRQCLYDRAEQVYAALVEGPQGAAVAAEAAAMLERLGDMEAAIAMYERAIAEGGFSEVITRRLEVRLRHARRQRPGILRFPVSVEAFTDARQVETLLAARQWPLAFAGMQRMLAEFGDTFLQQKPGQYLGVWYWSSRCLDALPQQAQNVHVEQSATAWRKTLADGSFDALRSFFASHPGTAVAGRSMLAWADTLADEGRIDEALALLNRRGVDRSLAAERHARWSPHSTPPLPLGTGPVELDSLAERLSSALRIALPPGIAGGDVGHAADGERLFLHHSHRVEAYDLARGSLAWQYVPDEPAIRQNVRREEYHHNEWPLHKWTGAFDRPGIAVCPQGVLVVENYHLGNPAVVHRTLTCLDRADGRVRWRLSQHPVFDPLLVCSDPVAAGGRVYVAVCSRRRFPEYWLCALSAADGRLLWRRHIAIGTAPTACTGSGLLYAGRSGPTLAVDGQTIYFATHMGAVVGIDADLGQPLWATSYPRISRFGPVTRSRLPLLERRTEPMIVTPRFLVILPRDLNALVLIDRDAAEAQIVARSLEWRELIHAEDDFAVLTTLAGEIRCVGLPGGEPRWSRAAPGTPLDRPAVCGNRLLVTDAQRLDVLDPATGKVQKTIDLPAPCALVRAGPAETWLSEGDGELRAIQGAHTHVPATLPEDPAARATGEPVHGWRYDAYLPGQNAQGRLVVTAQQRTVLVRADAGVLSGHDADDRCRLLWQRPLDSAESIWAASEATTAAVAGYHAATMPKALQAAPLVALCTDGRTVRLLDAATGRLVAAGAIPGIEPVRRLHVVRRTLLVAGTATLAVVSPRTDGSLDVHWQHDFAPAVFETFFPAESGTYAVIHPAPPHPAAVMRFHSSSMESGPATRFVLAAPLPVQEQNAQRYPIERLSYRQDDVLFAGGDRPGPYLRGSPEHAAGTPGAPALPLHAGPPRVLDCHGGLLYFEMTGYLGVMRLSDGMVTLVSEPAAGGGKALPQAPLETPLLAWLRAHPNHPRHKVMPFHISASGWSYTVRTSGAAASDHHVRTYVLSSPQGELPLGRLIPERIDAAGERLLVSSPAGTLLLGRYAGGAASTAPENAAGKAAVDLFAPPAVRLAPAAGLELNGELDDWPAGDWHLLECGRHAWPAGGARADRRPDARPEPPQPISGRFQVALDDDAIWLAISIPRMDGGRESSRPADRLWARVHFDGRAAHSRAPLDDPEPAAVTVSFRLVDQVPLARIRSRGTQPMLAAPVGWDRAFEDWHLRRYGQAPAVSEQAAVACLLGSDRFVLEMRMDRDFFAARLPAGFDIMLYPEVHGQPVSLSLAGALLDPAHLMSARWSE